MCTNRFAFAVLCLSTLWPLGAVAQIQNPSFETGTFVGSWTVTGVGAVSVGGVEGFPPEDGNYQAIFASVSLPDTISQIVPTIVDEEYELVFWNAYSGDASPPNGFSASFAGNPAYTTVLPGSSTFAYKEVVSPEILATTDASTLSFTGIGGDGGYLLDNISLLDLGPEPGGPGGGGNPGGPGGPGGGPGTDVPEPASFALLLIPLLGLMGVRRRSR